MQLLQSAQMGWSATQEAQLAGYVRLVQEWNPFAKLVSVRSEGELLSVHVPDCLSLAPLLKRMWDGVSSCLDIGSGGGLPAIPVKIALPGLPLVLIERSAKKVGFLRKVSGALGLEGVVIVHGAFPAVQPPSVPGLITARAVEKPLGLCKPILALVEQGAQFLCQSVLSESIPPSRFEVAPVDDMWTSQGLRRGRLYLVRRKVV